MAKWSAVLLLLLPLSSATPAARTATDWYVAASIGSDANVCTVPTLPCKTMNGAIVQAQPGDTIFVTNDIYTGSGASEIVRVDRSLTISGGWDLSFSAQSGYSIVNGEHQRQGIVVQPGADLVISDVAVIWCRALDGGGVYVQGGFQGTRMFIVQNYAFFGGGIYFDGSVGDNFLLIDSALYANTYSAQGGGLFVNGLRHIDPEDPNRVNFIGLFNVTVSNNTSVVSIDEEHGGPPTFGGGVYVRDSILQITHATFAENTVFDGVRFFTQTGAGLSADITSTVHFQNTLVADGCDAPGTFLASDGNNVERGISCNFGLVVDRSGIDPLIYPATVNPGPNSTITHAIAPGSLAVNRANNSWCLNRDQRGIARPQGLKCDTGAYERTDSDPAMGYISHPGQGVADSDRCPTLDWNRQGRGQHNPCEVDPDTLVRAVLGRIPDAGGRTR